MCATAHCMEIKQVYGHMSRNASKWAVNPNLSEIGVGDNAVKYGICIFQNLA